MNNVLKKPSICIGHPFISILDSWNFFLAKVRAKEKKRNGQFQLLPDSTFERVKKRMNII